MTKLNFARSMGVGLLLVVATPVLAQQPPVQRIDARLADSTIAAMQALLALRDKEMEVIKADATKMITDTQAELTRWKEYAKPLYAAAP